MRLLLFVSAFGVLVSIGVLIIVLLKARKDERDANPPRFKKHDD